MKRWSHLFVGRQIELNIMQSAYAEAVKGSPRVIAIVAESGFGKTRLVQEFFNWLSTTHDAVDGAGYWPDRLLRKEDNLVVNPDIVECGANSSTMPFLWWALRLPDPGARNEVITGALWPGVDRLKPHLHAQAKAVEQARIWRETRNELLSGAKDIAIDVVGNVFSFGLLGLGKTVVEKGYAIKTLLDKRLTNWSHGSTLAEIQRRAEDELTTTILADLYRLAKQPPTGINPIPLVVVIDDAQWLPEDKGSAGFIRALLDRARAESWPLLLLMTSWGREWNETRSKGLDPGHLVEETRGDRILKLSNTLGLDQLVGAAFPGLPSEQSAMIVDKADGNPRFLDEILLHLDCNPKFFVGKNKAAPLTQKGLDEVRSREFASLVAERFGEASEQARRALGLASIHGVAFSPRIVKLTAERLAIADTDQGLREGEDPNGFVVLSNEGREGEFRLAAYRKAAEDELGNLLDEDEVHAALNAAHTTIVADIMAASDRDLAVVMESSNDHAAICAAEELISRANARNDLRSAGTIAAKTLPRIDKAYEGVPLVKSVPVFENYFEWFGPRREAVNLLKRILERARNAAKVSFADRIQLALALPMLANIVQNLEGPAAARPYWVEAEVLACVLAAELQSHEHRDGLATVRSLQHKIILALEGPAAAKPYLLEAEALYRELAKEPSTPDARQRLAKAISQLGDLIEALEGPAAAKPYLLEAEAQCRALAKESGTPKVRLHLAYSISQLGNVIKALEGPAAAKPYLLEAEALFRIIALELGTPNARHHHAYAISQLGDLIEALEGPGAAKSFRVESEALYRKLAKESGTPEARRSLAYAISYLGDVIRALEGPAAVKPYLIEEEALYRVLAAESGKTDDRQYLAHAISKLGGIVLTLEGPAAAKPYLFEAEALYRELSNELGTPEARRRLAEAISRLGFTIRTLEGPAAVKPYLIEEEALYRVLAAESGKTDDRQYLAHAISKLGGIVLTLEGPAAAKPYLLEAETLFRSIALELGTPDARDDLAHWQKTISDLPWVWETRS